MIKYFYILFTLIFIVCCKNISVPENCASTDISAILNVEHTSTLAVGINQPIAFTITHGIANGCGVSSSQKIVKEGNVINISMLTKYEGCVCTEIY